MNDEDETRRRVAEADRMFTEAHPGDGGDREGCGPVCHRVAHLRQTALVFAVLARRAANPSP